MSKQLVPYSEGFLVRVRYEGGGEVPEVLSGHYTSTAEAQKAIDTYIPTRRVRKPTNGDIKS